jgi:hypothetical protein
MPYKTIVTVPSFDRNFQLQILFEERPEGACSSLRFTFLLLLNPRLPPPERIGDFPLK